MILIFGIIAVIVGSLLIGYSVGLRAGKRKHIVAKDMRIAELELKAANRSMDPVADRGNIPFREPTNDHERAIVEAVDEQFLGNPGNRQPTLLDYLDISAPMDFVMSASDSQFLLDYLNWRLTHPIRPSN
jgi:hypothetical protein